MSEIPPSTEAVLRVPARPADVNVNGDIFGGWVLSQMDIGAGTVARQRAKGRVTTVALDAMTFIRPVRVGDILCVYAWVDRVGKTSMGIHIEAWALRQMDAFQMEKVTEAMFTFVAIDEDGRPRKVPAEG